MIIMIKQFVNRERELSWLEDTNGLLVLYGRRRVGKTELIKEFCRGKKHLYFLATQKTEKENMWDMQRLMADHLDDDLFRRIEFTEWEDLFHEFINKVDEHVIIAIDEFPYLSEVNKAIPSIFQKIWDEILKEEDITMILCGSSISMMERHVLGRKSPLYGRRTGQWRLKPFKFADLKKFFPDAKLEDRMWFYSLADGIPQYLGMMDTKYDTEWNIKHNVLSKGCYLYEEAENLLRQEFRKPSNYFSILQAIAEGNTRYGEIVNRTGFNKPQLSQYLKNLQELHVLDAEFPVTQKKRSRNALYRLSDNYYDFWFEFIYPNKSMLEEGKIDKVLKRERNNLRRHVSFVFEQICREYILEESSEVGRWWKKGEEIDVVGIDRSSNNIVYGECKYSKHPVGIELFERLKKKAELVDGKYKHKEYVIFSWSGFDGSWDDVDTKDLRLVNNEDLTAHFG